MTDTHSTTIAFSAEQRESFSNIEVAEALGRIWQVLFNDPQQRFAAHDDFFKIGGSSLLAMALMEKVHHAFQVRLPLKVLLATARFGELAEHIATALANKAPARHGDLEHGVF